MIHIAMPFADVFGAGTCGRHLIAEFAKRGETLYDYVPGDDLSADVVPPEGAGYLPLRGDIDYPLLQFAGPQLDQQTRFRGKPNVAYIFSEWSPVTPEQRGNLLAFDVLVAGSEWNAQVIRGAGFTCAAVPQGVDSEVFKPIAAPRDERRFVIYSGGKWEPRKGQDIVIKAAKVMQERHADVALVASWVNLWGGGDGYEEARRAGVRLNGLPMLSQRNLARVMNQTDVGLFPNRCEGGTNLVLMDYLACGKPVVASVTTGQRDVLENDYCLPLSGSDDEVLEQSISGLEVLYQDRERGARMGAKAAVAMKDFPWSRTAEGIERAIHA